MANNKLFESEDKMQEWLSNEFKASNNLENLISNPDEVNNTYSTYFQRKLQNCLSQCYESFSFIEIISENKDISLQSGEQLKPDFVAYAPETEALLIIELKNIKGSTREGGTEISAYAHELKTYLPYLSDSDTINIIISNEWPTLLKHAVIHEVVWNNRKIICLRPHVDTDSEKIKLEILPVTTLTKETSINFFSPKHLGGYHLCLYDDELYQNPENRNRHDNYIEHMKTSMNIMANEGITQNNHGFAILWTDDNLKSLAPYVITIVNVAPFKSLERILHSKEQNWGKIGKRLANLIREFDPTGHCLSLEKISNKATPILETFSSPRFEGYCTWDDLRNEGNLNRKNIYCISWGIFQELITDKILQMSANIENAMFQPQILFDLLNEIIDENYNYIDFTNWPKFGEKD